MGLGDTTEALPGVPGIREGGGRIEEGRREEGGGRKKRNDGQGTSADRGSPRPQPVPCPAQPRPSPARKVGERSQGEGKAQVAG